MSAGAPRSTCSHCGSLQALAQRVPASPSTAADAGVPAPSLLDAVAGLPWDSRVAACAGDGPASSPSTSRATSAGTARRSDGRSTMTPVRQGTELESALQRVRWNGTGPRVVKIQPKTDNRCLGVDPGAP